MRPWMLHVAAWALTAAGLIILLMVVMRGPPA